ncbi:hypothetical protein ACJRO7_020395 [Eucalyptus globulus]|uniref:Uncharacterized protein n=1 Tax=Eucalyptus globulus TaxID=34317 RepID=A0ABD3KI06_EUCGL
MEMEEERLSKRLNDLDHGIRISESLVTHASQLVEDETPVFDEPWDDCDHLLPLMQVRSSIAHQAMEENNRMEDHLAALCFATVPL